MFTLTHSDGTMKESRLIYADMPPAAHPQPETYGNIHVPDSTSRTDRFESKYDRVYDREETRLREYKEHVEKLLGLMDDAYEPSNANGLEDYDDDILQDNREAVERLIKEATDAFEQTASGSYAKLAEIEGKYSEIEKKISELEDQLKSRNAPVQQTYRDKVLEARENAALEKGEIRSVDLHNLNEDFTSSETKATFYLIRMPASFTPDFGDVASEVKVMPASGGVQYLRITEDTAKRLNGRDIPISVRRGKTITAQVSRAADGGGNIVFTFPPVTPAAPTAPADAAPTPEAPTAAETPDYARLDQAGMPGYDTEGDPVLEADTPAPSTPPAPAAPAESDPGNKSVAPSPVTDAPSAPTPTPETAKEVDEKTKAQNLFREFQAALSKGGMSAEAQDFLKQINDLSNDAKNELADQHGMDDQQDLEVQGNGKTYLVEYKEVVRGRNAFNVTENPANGSYEEPNIVVDKQNKTPSETSPLEGPTGKKSVDNAEKGEKRQTEGPKQDGEKPADKNEQPDEIDALKKEIEGMGQRIKDLADAVAALAQRIEELAKPKAEAPKNESSEAAKAPEGRDENVTNPAEKIGALESEKEKLGIEWDSLTAGGSAGLRADGNKGLNRLKVIADRVEEIDKEIARLKALETKEDLPEGVDELIDLHKKKNEELKDPANKFKKDKIDAVMATITAIETKLGAKRDELEEVVKNKDNKFKVEMVTDAVKTIEKIDAVIGAKEAKKEQPKEDTVDKDKEASEKLTTLFSPESTEVKVTGEGIDIILANPETAQRTMEVLSTGRVKEGMKSIAMEVDSNTLKLKAADDMIKKPDAYVKLIKTAITVGKMPEAQYKSVLTLLKLESGDVGLAEYIPSFLKPLLDFKDKGGMADFIKKAAGFDSQAVLDTAITISKLSGTKEEEAKPTKDKED